MSDPSTELAALDAAIASGLLTVRFGDRMTTYQSMDDLLKARKFVAAKQSPGRRAVRFSVATFNE